MKIGEPVAVPEPVRRTRYLKAYLAVRAANGQAVPVKCDSVAEALRLQDSAYHWGGTKWRSARAMKVHTKRQGTTVYIWPRQDNGA